MKMNRLALLVLPLLVLAACKKESTESLNEKITRRWQIDKYIGQGVDSTAFFNFPYGGYTIDIKTGGQYTERYSSFGSPKVVNGTWDFLTGGAFFRQIDSSQTRVFECVSVEADYLKLKTPGKDQQFWLKPKP